MIVIEIFLTKVDGNGNKDAGELHCCWQETSCARNCLRMAGGMLNQRLLVSFSALDATLFNSTYIIIQEIKYEGHATVFRENRAAQKVG